MPVSAGGAGVQIKVEPPIEFILKQTGAFRRALFDFSSLWERFKPIMGEIEAEQFASSGRGAWPPLAESTVARKGHGEILVDTGALKASLLDPNEAMHIAGMSAWYGTEVEYAHWHQTGGTIAGRPPQRQVIPDPLPVDVRRRLETVQVAWINEIAARTVGRI